MLDIVTATQDLTFETLHRLALLTTHSLTWLDYFPLVRLIVMIEIGTCMLSVYSPLLLYMCYKATQAAAHNLHCCWCRLIRDLQAVSALPYNIISLRQTACTAEQCLLSMGYSLIGSLRCIPGAYITMPPSMLKVCPVMYEAAGSIARNFTSPATSSGWPYLSA